MKRPDLFAEMTIPNLFSPERTTEFKNEVDSCVKVAKSQPMQGIIANIRGMMQRPDRTEVFRNLGCPKLFVHGKNDPVLDKFTGRKTVRRELKTSLRNSWKTLATWGILRLPKRRFVSSSGS